MSPSTCGEVPLLALAQRLDDALGRNVPRAAIHDMKMLVALVGARVRVGVAVDGLQLPFGILECHVLILLLVVLLDNLRLALLALRGRAVASWLLLLLLMELLRKLLDFPALLRALASAAS
jgi:hypothetical protein